MKKTISLISLIFLCIFVQNIFAQGGLHSLGLLPEEPYDKPWIKPSNIQPQEGLAGSVFNLAYLPPIGNQGSQGSCTAWAVVYYFKTYQEAREKQWDPSLPENQCSPAFAYNLINGGRDGGSYISDAFKLLQEMGCGTMADMPYNAGNYTDWPNETAFENGTIFRTQNTHYISTRNTFGIDQIKQVLNNGELLVIGISVYPNFDNIAAYNYTYCVSDAYGSSRGGHAVAIVGYDDNKQTHDGPGAFRMVNSWGSGWGQSGFWWMSYEAVKSSKLCHGFAYYADDRLNYTPELLARYEVEHPHRGSVGVKVGVGDVNNPLWSFSFFKFYISNWYLSAYPYPDNPIVLDATDGAPYLNPGSTDNFFLTVSDSLSDGLGGKVEFFRGEFNAQMMTATATNLPAFFNETNPVSVAVPLGGALSIYPLTLNFGEVLMGSSVQETIAFDNMGTQPDTLNLQWETGSSPHFSLSGTSIPLSSGQSQTITVTYAPPMQGRDEARLLINGSTISAHVRLRGKAIGTLQCAPGAYDFGQVQVGQTVSEHFVVRNIGSQIEQVSLSIGGEHSGHFQVAPQQMTVNPGDSQYCTVTFQPLSPELKRAVLQVSAPGQWHESQLSGFGMGVPLLGLPVTALNKSVLLGDSLLALLDIENIGSFSLTYSAALQFSGSDSGWIEIQNPTGSITPGGSKKIMFWMRGQAPGIFQATCLISTNEPGSSPYSLPVRLKVVEINEPEHFIPCFSGTPYQPMTLKIIHAEWGGQELEAGDEIAVFDGNRCVGSGRLRFTAGMGLSALTILASEDDPSTTPIDGFINGNPITFKIWDYSEGSEYIVSAVEFLSAGGQPLAPQPFTRNGMALLRLGMFTSVHPTQSNGIPRTFTLQQNYPNPFNPSTTISFAIPQPGRVSLIIYNPLGQVVRTLVQGYVQPGNYSVMWDGRDEAQQKVASGIYIYNLSLTVSGASFQQSRKMLLVH
ncbi:MAG: hypothetical protein Kow0042_12660 [Calditrichia bacterium]